MRVNNRTVTALLLLTTSIGLGACTGGAFKSPALDMAPSRLEGARLETSGGLGGSGVVRSGAHDAGYFRHLVDKGILPTPDEITVEGVFAEHNTHLPSPHADRAITLHPLLGVSIDPIDHAPAAILQLGMNSHIDFSGLPRLPVNLAVVLDKSGSMNDDQKMTYVKEGLKLMLDSLGPQDTLSIVAYDSRAHLIMPPTPVRQPRLIAAIIDSIYPSGATNIHDGLLLGYQQLLERYDDRAVNRLMLLSDGVPTTGPTEIESIVAASDAFDRYNIGVSTIGVGTDFNHELMLQLARQGGGNFYFLQDAQRITTVFRDELETTLTPVAEDLTLTLEFDPQVRMIAAHGLPLALNRQGDPEIHIPTLYLSRRNGVMLVELDLGDLLDYEGPAHLGDAVLEYTFTDTGRRERHRYPIHMPEASSTLHGHRVFFEHAAVRKNFDLLMTVFGLQDACQAWQDNDPHAARAILQHLEAHLAAEAHDLEDAGLHKELATVRRLRSAAGR